MNNVLHELAQMDKKKKQYDVTAASVSFVLFGDAFRELANPIALCFTLDSDSLSLLLSLDSVSDSLCLYFSVMFLPLLLTFLFVCLFRPVNLLNYSDSPCLVSVFCSWLISKLSSTGNKRSLGMKSWHLIQWRRNQNPYSRCVWTNLSKSSNQLQWWFWVILSETWNLGHEAAGFLLFFYWLYEFINYKCQIFVFP